MDIIYMYIYTYIYMLTTRSWTYLFIGFVSNHQGSHATDRVGPHYKFAFDCCGFAPHYKFAFKGSDPTTSFEVAEESALGSLRNKIKGELLKSLKSKPPTPGETK